MNRKIIIGIVVSLLLIGALFYWMDSGAKSEKEKLYYSSWVRSYDMNSKEPRGLRNFMDLLQVHSGDSIVSLNTIEELKKTFRKEDTAVYIFIGDIFGMEYYNYDKLIQEVDSGATVLVSSTRLSEYPYGYHFRPGGRYWEYNDELYVWVGDTSLKYTSIYQSDTVYSDWYSFNKKSIIDSNCRSYLFAFDQPTAFYSKKNKGTIHFHSLPQLFQNYQVLTANGFAHAQVILNQLPKNQKVYWMECAKQQEQVESNFDGDEMGNEKVNDSYLQYILKRPALRNAFILALILCVIYIIFRSKRKEEILPGVPTRKNISLSFVETLSTIYISRNSPSSVLRTLRSNFYVNVNKHFYLDLNNKEKRKENYERLVQKSGFDVEKLKEIHQSFQTTSGVTAQEVGRIHNLIRQFYLHTGIYKPMQSFVGKMQEININRSLLPGALGLLLGFASFSQGAYLLSKGVGVGILLIMLATFFFFVSGKLLNRPKIKITVDKIIHFKPIFGKKEYSLKQGITVESSKTIVQLHFEEGDTLKIDSAFLPKSSKAALQQFIEFLKNKTT